MRPVALALVAGAVVLLAAVVLVASGSEPVELGNNRVFAADWGRELNPVQTELCTAALVPAGTDLVAAHLDSRRRDHPAVLLRVGASRGRLAPGGPIFGEQQFRLRPALTSAGRRRVCVSAPGVRPRGLGLGGLAGAAEVSRYAPAGLRARGTIRLEFFSSRPRSWWSRLGTITERFGWGKTAAFGSWTIVLALVLVLAALGTAARALLRAPDEA